jgi:hypothetical protein
MNGTSSEELEREAEVARANVAETADAIRSKMTPGQMIDEFTGMFSGGDGQATLSTLKAQIRDNPLPLTLVGAGLAWLMLGQGESRAKFAGHGWSDKSRSSEKDGLNHSVLDDGTGDTITDTVRDTASEAMSKAGRVLGSAKQAIGAAGARASSTGNYLTDQAGDMAGWSRRAASDIFEKEPLVLAALGIAVGTAIGVLLPHSALEDEHLSGVATKVRAKADDLLDKGVTEAKDMAVGAYETLKEEADRQGVRSEDTVVDKVTEVIKSTARRTEGAVRDKFKPGS